jgi:general secretion pathway protein K
MGNTMYRRRQQGVALITALLVVSLAVVAAAAMASRQQLDIRRTGNLLHGEQAYAYVSGAESWARVVLERDLDDNKIDTLEEDWATKPPVSIVEGGGVTGCILDLQGRFNLNSVVAAGKKDTNTNGGFARYKRLLEVLDLDAALADPLVDWIDENVNPEFPDGAEDDFYQLLQPAYRTSNQPLVNLSELRLIKGYTEDVIATLKPYVTALPDTGMPINVNTASAEVLRTIAEKISLSDAQKLLDQRPKDGFADVSAFTKLPELSGADRQPDPATLSVQSEWFAVLGESYIGQARSRLTALLHRGADGTTVVQRRREFADGLVCGAAGSGSASGSNASSAAAGAAE